MMLIKQNLGIIPFNSVKKSFLKLFLLTCFVFVFYSHSLYSNDTVCSIGNNLKVSKKIKSGQANKQSLVYYLYISDFVQSFIEIPTSNVSSESPIISSKYLAGRAPLYNQANQKVGTCSASFLCMQNAEGIYTDISNYISVDNGLIVTWFTPTTLINLELDSILHSMVTECIVLASTKVGSVPSSCKMRPSCAQCRPILIFNWD